VSQPAGASADGNAPRTTAGDPDFPFGPRIVWALLFVALLVFQGFVIFFQAHGTPATGGHHTRPAGEVAGQVAIRQTLTMEANGLDGLTVHVQASGKEHEGPVIFELGEAGADASGEADSPIYRTVVETRRVADDKTFTWRFTPLDDSKGKRYALRVSMPAAPFERGLTLLANRDEHYRDGQLWFDGREQWGDLVFETSARRATTFQRFEHALRDKPKWLRSRVSLGLFFALYNLALGIVLWTVLTASDQEGEAAADPAGHRQPSRVASPRARAGGLAVLVLVCAFAAYVIYEPRVRIEPGARELVTEFPETAKRTTMASLQDAFHYDQVTWNGRSMRCIMALPFSRINWSVDAQPNTELRGWYGMRQDTWQGNGDGSTFRVGIVDSGAYSQSVNRWLNPDLKPGDRTFVPIRVDLSPHAGRRIEVVLNTEPQLTPVGDAALWCEVRVAARE
jgi:hypothetical protein